MPYRRKYQREYAEKREERINNRLIGNSPTPSGIAYVLFKEHPVPLQRMLNAKKNVELPFRLRAGIINKWRREARKEADHVMRERMQA